MNPYDKIHSIYKRDETGRHLLVGDYSLDAFAFLEQNQWQWTEKVDGTNIRIMWDGESVTFGGKSDNASIPANLLKVLQEMFPKEDFVTYYSPDEIKEDETVTAPPMCLYGEGYGARIQKGGKYRPDPSFVLFDVKVGDFWLQRDKIRKVGQRFNIDVVPIVLEGTIPQAIDFVRMGFPSSWGDFQAEGIVGKPMLDLYDRHGRRIITKIKYKDFE